MALTIWQQRLAFLQEERSIAGLAREYGIPRQTLMTLKRGGTIPGGTGTPNFQNLWKTESYRAMRKYGMPSGQAARFRGGEVTSVAGKVETLKRMVSTLSKGAARSHFKSAWAEDASDWASPEVWGYIGAMTKKIRKSIQESMRPWEDIKEGRIS